jgi:hypothetical protein
VNDNLRKVMLWVCLVIFLVFVYRDKIERMAVNCVKRVVGQAVEEIVKEKFPHMPRLPDPPRPWRR